MSIVVDNVGMEYRGKSPGTLRERLAHPFRPRPRTRFQGLQHISFTLAPGRMLGVIGANGAGKSTLLRLLGGIGRPTTGNIQVSGRIGALLDLGGGFLADLTGRENAVLAGIVSGLLKSEMLERMPEIVKFAELESFINEPVRTYSSGMTMRLAFSIAVHTDPEVLLVDEFLSVGDLAFQAKCRARINELRGRGCAVVMVSHSMDQVRELCDEVLWLENGRVTASGQAEEVAALYESRIRDKMLARTTDAPQREVLPGVKLRSRDSRLGSLELEIDEVILRPGPVITSGDPLKVEIEFHANSQVPAPLITLSITRQDGLLCMDTNTELAHVAVPDIIGSARVTLTLDRVQIARGTYFVNVGLFEASWEHAYDYHFGVYMLNVEGAPEHKGVLAPRCEWEISMNHSL